MFSIWLSSRSSGTSCSIVVSCLHEITGRISLLKTLQILSLSEKSIRSTYFKCHKKLFSQMNIPFTLQSLYEVCFTEIYWRTCSSSLRAKMPNGVAKKYFIAHFISKISFNCQTLKAGMNELLDACGCIRIWTCCYQTPLVHLHKWHYVH